MYVFKFGVIVGHSILTAVYRSLNNIDRLLNQFPYCFTMI